MKKVMAGTAVWMICAWTIWAQDAPKAAETAPATPAAETPAATPAAPAPATPAAPAATAEKAPKAATVDETLEEGFMGSKDQPDRPSEVLSLKDITLLTMKHNLNVRIKEINPKITQQTITTAESEFDPAVEAKVQGGRSDSPSLDVFGNAQHGRTDSVGGEVGLTKKFITGGTATVKGTAEQTDTEGSGQLATAGASAEVTQPLLRGNGPAVNLVDIFIARNNTKISVMDFKSQVITTLAQSQTSYWELVYALENLEVQKRSWRLSKKTLLQTEAQVEAGVLARIEITRVRADVASKEEGIITAERTVEDQVDQLRRFIRQPGADLRDETGIVPIERVAFEPVKLELAKEIQSGLVNRPDYVQAKIDILNKDLSLTKTDNARLPQLDVTAGVGVNGVGNNTSGSISNLGDGDFVDWNLGASFSYPLGNRAAEAAYTQAQLQRKQSGLQLKNVEDQVIIDVKAAVRKVNADSQRVRSTRLARQLAEERLAAEEEKLNVGQAIILDLLEAQTLVAQTESAERRAIVDFQESMIQLEQAKGTLLESNNIFLAKK